MELPFLAKNSVFLLFSKAKYQFCFLASLDSLACCLLAPISAFFVSIVFHLCLLSLITCFSYLFSIVLIIAKPTMPYKNGFSVLLKKKIWHIFSWGASHQKLSSARSHVIELIVCTVSIAPFRLRLKDDRGLMTTKFQKKFPYALHR
jgi:hypothetical protein